MLRILRITAAALLLGIATLSFAGLQVDQRAWSMDPGEGYGEESASYLGIDVRDITPDRMAALKLKEESGAEITMVDQDAPAGKVGLKEHDVILQLNGTKIESVEQLRRLLRETPPGRSVALSISRDGQPMTIKAVLADRRKVMTAMAGKGHTFAVVPMPPMPPMTPMEIPAIDVMVRTPSRAGIVIESLTPQLGEYFGVKNGEGVLVRSVEKGSPAEQAGMKAGDVIIRVDKNRIADRNDWREAMRKRSGKVAVGVIRDRREQTLTLTLPETKSPDDSFRFDIPDVDLEVLNHELEQLRPQIQKTAEQAAMLARDQVNLTLQQAGIQIQKQMEQARKDLEKARKDMERAQRKMEKQAPPASE